MANNGTYTPPADNPIIPWLDDNETKYKWNGALTNFSDLDPKDYAVTIFYVSGITTDSTQVDKITLTVEKGATNYYVKAVPQYGPASNLTINVDLTSGSPITMTMASGATIVTADTGIAKTEAQPGFSSTSVVPVKDDSYKYQIDTVDTATFSAYHGTWLKKNISGITATDIAGLTKASIAASGTSASFSIQAVPGLVEAEWPNYEKVLLFSIPKTVYSAGTYRAYNQLGSDITSQFVYEKDFTVEGVLCALLINRSEDTEYVPAVDYDKTYLYTFKYVRS